MHGFADPLMPRVICDVELGADASHTLEAGGTPFVDCNLNSHLTLTLRLNCLNCIRNTACVHVEEGLDDRLHDNRAAHLPDRQRPTLDELLNAVLLALVDELRA